MHYNPSTGKRIKDETIPGRINWLHTTLKRCHQLPKDWQLTQCLFGEHLLPQRPDKTVALVESEKTAIICAALMPHTSGSPLEANLNSTTASPPSKAAR